MRNIRLFSVNLIIIVQYIFLASCTELASDFTEKSTTDEIFLAGENAFKKKDFTRSAEIYLKINEYFPYSDDARKALVKAINSFHMGANFHELREVSKQFLELYPQDKNAPFAKYMVGMSYFEQIIDVERDQGATRDSIREFSDLILLFPKSEYAALAKENIKIAKNQLAGQEMSVGRYYLKKANPLAALNRFQAVMKRHQNSPFYPEALYRTVETYLMMGVDTQALEAYNFLNKKFPKSKWTALAFSKLQESNLMDE